MKYTVHCTFSYTEGKMYNKISSFEVETSFGAPTFWGLYPCEAFDICNFASRLADRQKGFCGFCGCHLATDSMAFGHWTLAFILNGFRL